MVAIDASSSCGPQPNSQFPPPMAHVPRPSGVISKSVFPSCLVRTYIHSFLLLILLVIWLANLCFDFSAPAALPKAVLVWAVRPTPTQPTPTHDMSHWRWRDVLEREGSPAI